MIFAATAIAVLALSCTREAELYDALTGGIEMEFTASWAQDGDSRTLIAENGTDILWNVDERINAFYGTQYAGVFTSTNTEPSALVTFHGTLDVLSGSMEAENSQRRFWSVYPYNESNTCDGESVTLTLSQNQVGKAGSFADKFFPAVASGTTPDLAFYNLCGGARFSIVTEGVQKIVFRSNDGSPMAGTVRVDFGVDGKPQILKVSDAIDSVVVNAPIGGFVPGENYFAAMLPQTHEQGLTVTLYTATKRAVKTINKSITVKRSVFGVLDNVDEGLTNWEEYAQETEGGGTRSGLYLGIIGFNQQLYKMPIERLNAASQAKFNSFIDDLAAKKGTLLYYSVDQAMHTLSRAAYPDNLFNVSLVTFTDGLDQGSAMMIEDYPGDDEYLQELNTRLSTEQVKGLPLTAYSVGLKGSDVSDAAKFSNNLQKLANPSSNAFEVSSMSTVNSRFQAIADQLSQTLTTYSYDLSISIPGQANGTKVRFTLDNVSSATSSNLYIEGVFNLQSKSLTGVTCQGLTLPAGDTVQGEVDGIFVRFPFNGLVVGDGKSFSQSNIKQWNYITSTAKWQINTEFDAETDASVEMTTIKRSAVILLNLDCSSSLGSDFSTLKSHAKSFIDRLYQASIDPQDVTGVSLDKTALTLYEGTSATLTATVTPSTAANKNVTWSSSDAAVATVNPEGVVAAVSAGTAVITVTTVDGGFTAECTVTVKEIAIPEAVDLGLPSGIKWASFNLGATKPEEYGDYFAWGETFPKEDYSWSTYKWCMNGSGSQLTKYCSKSSYGYNGFTDNKTVLDPEDDAAAAANLGGSWRMATYAEWDELKTKCTWTWTTQNGVNGRLVTGPNGNSIFLPAAGYRNGTSLYYAGSLGYYWSSSLSTSYPYYAYNAYFNSDSVDWYYLNRYSGRAVRPVSDESIHVSGVSVLPEKATVISGKTLQLVATITPPNATEKGLMWSSSDESVATVNVDGLVTGVAAGTAIVTVTTIEGGFDASCTIVVNITKAVDLGLSVKWASFNVGASAPEDYGDYFAWGEVEPKEDYSWSTYKWCINGSSPKLTKYCNASRLGYNEFTDDKTVLDPEDDAAAVNWGDGWRSPTKTEQDELRANCTWEWTTLNGVYGRKITSKIENYTDNWIFLPAAGIWDGTTLYAAGADAFYWSSSLYEGDSSGAYLVYFRSGSRGWDAGDRFIGRSVRPVSE